jgi:hypothetical protein
MKKGLKNEVMKGKVVKQGGPVTKASGGVSQPIVMKHTVPAKSTHLSMASVAERRRDQSAEESPSSFRKRDQGYLDS